MYWRSPQGDIDIRVSAIAKYVFGLHHVFWTNDANDWCVLDDGTTYASTECKGITPTSLETKYKAWADASPQTGMTILSHELRKSEVEPLDTFYEALIQKKWKIGGVPILGLPWYNNAAKAGEKGTEGKDILPTSKPFEVSAGGHKVDLGGWAPGIGGGSTSTNSSSGGTKGGGSNSNTGSGGGSSSGTSPSTSTTSSSSSTTQPTNAAGSQTSGTSSTSTSGTASSSAAATGAFKLKSWSTLVGIDIVSALLWLVLL